MKALIAFTKKELLEQVRTGKLLFLGILFVLFGIMNPAIAKLTPWFLEMFADSLAESGMIITDVTVSAMDSWVQFFKNIPMALIAFILMEGSCFTREYQSGTLILSLTKGLARHKVVISKTLVLAFLWTVGYWLCFGITYGYNAYFWDNSVAQNLLCSVTAWWLFGLWTISLVVLFSTLSATNTGVLLGTGGAVLVSYLVGMIPKCGKFMPTLLTDGNSLIYGVAELDAYTTAMVITGVTGIVCLIAAVVFFNKKQL